MSKIHILYIEDDNIATDIGIKMFGLFDHVKTTHASTGYGALEAYEPGIFNCIIVDLGLPDISGTEVVQMIQRQYGSCPPVVAVTAHVNPNDERPKGIDRIYAKPLTYELAQEILNCYSQA